MILVPYYATNEDMSNILTIYRNLELVESAPSPIARKTHAQIITRVSQKIGRYFLFLFLLYHNPFIYFFKVVDRQATPLSNSCVLCAAGNTLYAYSTKEGCLASDVLQPIKFRKNMTKRKNQTLRRM